jgi:hypothetical protein
MSFIVMGKFVLNVPIRRTYKCHTSSNQTITGGNARQGINAWPKVCVQNAVIPPNIHIRCVKLTGDTIIAGSLIPTVS